MTRLTMFLALFLSGIQAQNAPAPVAITPRLDAPQVRVIVATLQPRLPVNARTGHATNRVIIYLDAGAMTRTDGDRTATGLNFTAATCAGSPQADRTLPENISDRPIRILEIDLKGAPGAPAALSTRDPVAIGQHALQG